ncbi:MAG: hypothetical protein ACC651_17495 [Candidatus Scalindua sp.]
MMLPPFQSFLDLNVTKEEKKDNFVISTAYHAIQEGKSLKEITIAPLLQEARKIDQKFLQQTFLLPISINIQYQEVEQIRRQRMELLLCAAYHLFEQWGNKPDIRSTFSKLFNQDQFSEWLYKILHLYNQETKILSHSVRLPSLLGLARNKLSNTIYSIMEDVSQQLITELTQIIYRR